MTAKNSIRKGRLVSIATVTLVILSLAAMPASGGVAADTTEPTIAQIDLGESSYNESWEYTNKTEALDHYNETGGAGSWSLSSTYATDGEKSLEIDAAGDYVYATSKDNFTVYTGDIRMSFDMRADITYDGTNAPKSIFGLVDSNGSDLLRVGPITGGFGEWEITGDLVNGTNWIGPDSGSRTVGWSSVTAYTEDGEVVVEINGTEEFRKTIPDDAKGEYTAEVEYESSTPSSSSDIVANYDDISIESNQVYTVHGDVVNKKGDPINNATVSLSDTYTATTNESGYFETSAPNGTHELKIEHGEYETYTDTVTISGDEDLGTFELERRQDPDLELDVPTLLNHGESYNYTVKFTEEVDGKNVTKYVTAKATVESLDTNGITVDSSAHTITATGNRDYNDRVVIRAEYNGSVMYKEVVVAETKVENLEVLPGIWRYSALIGDTNFFIILLATLGGVVGARWSTAFGGLGFFEIILAAGWFGGWLNGGLMLVSIFTALFIGFNMAANIDYTVTK